MIAIEKIIKCAKLRAIQRYKKEPFQFNHVSIVTTNKSILAYGRNNTKTHPALLKFDYVWSIHAEIAALLQIDKSIIYNGNELILYSFRFDSANFNLINAKPCEDCQKYFKHLTNNGWKFKEIYYSDDNGILQKLERELYV